MGVVNVTPDSFSDGGRFASAGAAVAHGLALAESGAAILDVGGESTRPDAEPVDESEELRRTVPVVRELVAASAVPVSIDTTKAAVAAAALEAGAAMVNDVSGGGADPGMLRVVAEQGVMLVVMHTRGTPRTMPRRSSLRRCCPGGRRRVARPRRRRDRGWRTRRRDPGRPGCRVRQDGRPQSRTARRASRSRGATRSPAARGRFSQVVPRPRARRRAGRLHAKRRRWR